MKSRAFNFRRIRKIVSIILISIMLFEIIPDVFENTKTVEAASNGLDVKKKWQDKINSLDWFEGFKSDDSLNVTSNSKFWYKSSDKVKAIDESQITLASDSEKANYETTNALGTLIKTNLDGSEFNYSDEVLMETDETVSEASYKGESSDVDLYYSIVRAEAYDTYSNYNDYNNKSINKYAYCRCYYVSTAAQLKIIFETYQTDYTKLMTTTSEIKAVTGKNSGVIVASKFVIKLLCDIDLGGANNDADGNEIIWNGPSNNTKINMEIDGQGNYLYNGYYGTTGYFLSKNTKFIIHDVIFSNHYLNHNNGMFGNGVTYAYFNNVNWENCIAESTSSSTTIVLGTGYAECYFKECDVRNSYVKSKGDGHCSMFASYNSESVNNYNIATYLGDSQSNLDKFYYTEIPDTISEVENLFRSTSSNSSKSINEEYFGKKLCNIYPSIFEDCATINCSVYEAKENNTNKVNHSGVFVSCIRSYVIFKNCYSNGSIYGQQQLGVFIGGILGCGDGFYYKEPETNETILVNSYFENCYTSGEVEGSASLGGFVGVIFNDGRAVGNDGNETQSITDPEKTIYFKKYCGSTARILINNSDKIKWHRGGSVFYNCYSTSSVGMEYSGEYIGGFVGVIRGNILATLNSDGTIDSSKSNEIKHRFINCYVAGEVGGIKTDNTIDKSNDNTIGGFIGVYRPEDYSYDITSTSDLLDTIDADGNVTKAGKTISGITTNCYYDKQTTNMRERSIGAFTETYSGSDDYDTVYQLSDTLAGLTGVYTSSSSLKGVSGLTDTKLLPDSAWVYSDDGNYYPQLKVFCEYPTQLSDDASLAEQMRYNRKILYYYDSKASTATVFLDHYDTILDTDTGLTRTATKDDSLVYDTVCDITRKFEFTTDDNVNGSVTSESTDEVDNASSNLADENNNVNLKSTVETTDGTSESESVNNDSADSAENYINQLKWETDQSSSSRNYLNNFVDKLGKNSSSTGGFTLDYGNLRKNAIIDENGTSTGSYDLSRTFTPSVLTIQKVNDSDGISTYKCLDFAPGKQWVTVTASSGVEDSINDPAFDETAHDDEGNPLTAEVNYIKGSRELRLLPTAYLNAGEILHVNVIKDDNNSTTNSYYYTLNGVEVELQSFNHSIGVAYAITDRYRMGTSSVYTGQSLVEYESNSKNAYNDNNFAFYSKFNMTGTNQLFGTNGVKYASNGKIESIDMLDQNYDTITNSEGVYLNNKSTSGKTIARIFKAKINTDTKQLEKTTEITYNDTNIKKWTGEANFTTNDVGYYYVEYYWALNDGRYLTDDKLVRISSNSYDVEMITGILNEEQTVDDTSATKTAIDQYVTDNVQLNGTNSSLITTSSFPSKEEEFNSQNAYEYYYYDENTKTYQYNIPQVISGSTYYTKTLKISTNKSRTAVGWQRTTDYVLSTLIIEAIDSDGVIHQMARIDDINDPDKLYDLEDASYAYNYTTFSVEQDPESKLFNITSYNELPITFSVKSSSSVAGDSIEKFIIFDFTSGVNDTNGQTVSYSENSNNLRVTALFRKNTAEIEPVKSVLLLPEDVDDLGEEVNSTRDVAKSIDGNASENNASSINEESGDSNEETNLEEVNDVSDDTDATDRLNDDKDKANSDSVVQDVSENVITDDNSGTGNSDGNNSTSIKIEKEKYTYYKSLSETQKKYEVDDSGIEDDSQRLAVLPGDTITYRVKLQNVGYFESGEVKVSDEIPDYCTYVPNSMKIYRQVTDVINTTDEYTQVEVVASFDDDGELSVNENFKNVKMVQPSESSSSLKWEIPSIALGEDYYVQYEVTVDELSASDLSKTLTNTAVTEYYCHNGDVKNLNKTPQTLSELLNNEFFDLSMEYGEEASSDNNSLSDNEENSIIDKGKAVTYTVKFNTKYTDTTYENIIYTNEFSDNFKLSSVEILKSEKGSTSEDLEYSASYQEDTKQLVETSDGNDVENETKETTDANSENNQNSNKLSVTYNADTNSLSVEGLSLTDVNQIYTVILKGTESYQIGQTYKDADGNDKIAKQLKTTAQVTYTEYTKSEEDGTVSTPSRKGNSISRIETISNKVETDVIHLYYEIDKKIESEVSDLSQSFLFKVTYYKNQAELDAAKSEEDSAYLEENVITEDTSENTDDDFTEEITVNEDVESKVEVSENTEAGTDNSNTIAIEESEENVSYVRISCDTKSTVTKSDDTQATVWTGSKLIQCDKRGIYVIEELTDWSSTDYDFVEIINNQTDTNNDSAGNSSAESSQNTALSEATEDSDKTVEAETIKSTVLKMYIDSTDYYDSPNAYTLAIPTQVGTYLSDLTNHTVTFINSPSDYAYLSSQAYIENNFK